MCEAEKTGMLILKNAKLFIPFFEKVCSSLFPQLVLEFSYQKFASVAMGTALFF